MFADFDVPGTSSATKVFVRKNGTAGPLKEVILPPNSKLADLFEKSRKALDIEAPLRAFYSNGVECIDVDNIEEDEVIHISRGEPFKASEGQDAGFQVVGNFILHEKLGQGGFGSVVKGVHSETGEAAAVKFVPKKSFRQFSDLQRAFQEIQALRNLKHPNIVRVLDVADHPDSICFIMEFAAGGELRGYVERHGSLSEEESRSFFKQIVRAVHYIHSKKIIHRDLKLENILLDKENRCKIVDFGLSDYVSTKERTVTDAGTEAYLAPEVYNGTSKEADPYKIDVWGLGVILFALAHGKLPFSRPDEETCARLDADGLTFKEALSPGFRRLVKLMLVPNPERRASMNEITLDSWVTKNRFAACELTGSFADDDEEAEDLPRLRDHRPSDHSVTPSLWSTIDADGGGAVPDATGSGGGAGAAPGGICDRFPGGMVPRRRIDGPTAAEKKLTPPPASLETMNPSPRSRQRDIRKPNDRAIRGSGNVSTPLAGSGRAVIAGSPIRAEPRGSSVRRSNNVTGTAPGSANGRCRGASDV